MSDQSRRKLLKSIAATGGSIIVAKTLPDSWIRPAVHAMVLPAHAQATLPPGVVLACSVSPDPFNFNNATTLTIGCNGASFSIGYGVAGAPTLTNDGTVPITVNSITFDIGVTVPDFPHTSAGSFPQTLNPGESFTFSIEWTAVNTAISGTGTVNATTTDYGPMTCTFAVTGTCTPVIG